MKINEIIQYVTDTNGERLKLNHKGTGKTFSDLVRLVQIGDKLYITVLYTEYSFLDGNEHIIRQEVILLRITSANAFIQLMPDEKEYKEVVGLLPPTQNWEPIFENFYAKREYVKQLDEALDVLTAGVNAAGDDENAIRVFQEKGLFRRK